MGGARAAALVTAVVSGGVTVTVALFSPLHFVYRQPLLHVAVETAASLIALLAGFLVFGRLRRAAHLNELVLGCALAVLALLDIFFLTVPAIASLVPRDLTVLAALAGYLLAASLFTFAAFAPRRRLRRAGLALAAGVAGGAAASLLAAILVSGFTAHVPQGGAAALLAGSPAHHANPARLSLRLAMAVLYGAAAVGFLNRSQRFGDEFFGWLALAAVLAAAAHVNYFLYPSPYAQWVHTGDVFRLCFYAVLLAGSMREISSYWRALSAAAVLEERRRIARDLHDGLAQELAYLARNLHSAGAEPGEGTLRRLRAAVERAQLESRRAVNTLTATGGQAVEVALAEAATEVAERLQVGLELDLAPGMRVSAARAEALVRIACEAIANAARHSGARRVSLHLERDGSRVRLRVCDTGRGFDTMVPGGGFGLISMRERARSVGGELRISSAPGRGSEVEAAL
ncbi:MAG: sensor histidine kinase [Micromonosporaceae bacterium]